MGRKEPQPAPNKPRPEDRTPSTGGVTQRPTQDIQKPEPPPPPPPPKRTTNSQE